MYTAQLPDSIGDLKKLETLNLAANGLSSLPEGIINLKAIKTVNLSQNSLQTFPLFLCQLTHLDFADLSDNKIEELPEGIQVLNAVELNVNRNSISVIPASLAWCRRLKVLRIVENTLSLMGIPPAILSDSSISLLCTEGNLFEVRELQEMPEYAKVHKSGQGWSFTSHSYTLHKRVLYITYKRQNSTCEGIASTLVSLVFYNLCVQSSESEFSD